MTNVKYHQEIISILSEFEDERLRDDTHVEKWLVQFSEENRGVILEETVGLLRKYYFSKESITSSLVGLVNKNLDKDKDYTLIHFSRPGSSREYFTNFISENADSIGLNLVDDSNNFLIFDDCIFSGNTLIKELEDWLATNYKIGIKIYIITHAYYEQGLQYLQYRMNKAKLEGNYKFDGTLLSSIVYTKGHLMTPKIDSSESKDYYTRLSQFKQETQTKKPLVSARLSRVMNDPLFSSESARTIYENEMLAYGVRIVDALDYPIQTSIRPMGYDARLSFGFGAFYANFRNISNNCPLALWYRSTIAYPLIDRKIR